MDEVAKPHKPIRDAVASFLDNSRSESLTDAINCKVQERPLSVGDVL
jgi:hypothetical protein